MKKIYFVSLLLISFLFSFSSVSLFAKENNGALQQLINASKSRADLVEAVQQAVVHIKVVKFVKNSNGALNDPTQLFNDRFFEKFFPGMRPPSTPPHQRNMPPKKERRQEGLGTGSIITSSGYILTNHHVVGDSDKITVRFYDGSEMEAKLIGTDPEADIAVIKVDATGLKTLPMGNSEITRVGETVIAVGNPFGLTQTVTMGIISAKGRNNIGINNYENFIQTDAAINPGNSGGPLISLQGKMIGVNTAIYTRSGGYQGIGFAVPVNMARRIMEDLINNGRVSRGWLGVGIQDITKELANIFHLSDTNGVLISGVMPDMPAEKAGLRKGDIVIALNEKKILNTNDLRNRIASSRVGSIANLKILRNTGTLDLKVKLEEKPSNTEVASSPVAPAPVQTEEENVFGFVVEELTAEMAQKLEEPLSSGVLIKKILPDSIAKAAGLRPGILIQEINRTAVHNLKEFREAMRAANPQEGVLFLITSTRGTRYVVLRVR